ncbi:adenylate/guanylate cyclase domain-containing protein [Paraburkholderia sp. FT54]|uniref:adenylate/guanylate cyclase domain-containing protein n=1 Tax=Paraburkholderia sp. FT54 TaxID=3074437 RepID=UPI00287746EE|nr:adenylate/guanylate cyclase domain-containing protein [Paraburkholderia sp. FT54]WNC94978.1 adenylate/guanylate cyclase domain-containing protein [Paraburkholderia sp. FT54]
MHCTNCGAENRDGVRFCEQCGTELARTCANCGHELSPAAKFCSECGAPVGEQSSRSMPARTQAPAPLPIHYTPSHLAARILAEQAAQQARGQNACERKTITALFADMAGSTALIQDLDPEEAHRLIAPVVELMMEAVHHYEGFVAKSLGDGILALFGAPIAHEDHPQRALYAALRMQRAMRRHSDRIRLERGIPLQIRVGVHTGEVIVRSVRKDDLHTDYDPVGHTIHIASRMEAIATPSSILVSESTFKLTEGYFEFKALGQTQVKGVARALAVYEVASLGALRTRLQVAEQRGLARFVGRQAELEQLRKVFDEAKAGRGHVVGVVGEAGVGKSRLFHEFKSLLRRACLVVETFSVSHGKSFAWLPLVQLLENYFQITGEDDERRRREKVAGRVLTLERSLEEVVPYLLHLLGIGEPNAALVQMDSQIRRERMFEAVTRLLVRESLDNPLALVFEDLQWLDNETQAFLSFLVDGMRNAQILLLLNYRPEFRHDWGDKTWYTQLRLDPLGRADAQALLTALVGDDSGLVPVKQLILDGTEGNPFFIEEVVRTLVEERALLGEPGCYRMERTPTALHIPTTVQGVLASRIDRLPVAEKELLQTLAVIGKEFSASLVQHVVEQPEDELIALFSRLEAGEFIYEQPAFPEVEYAFKHALTQEVAGNSMLTERRGVLHERTAQAIEALFHSRLKDYLNELAHHYSLSGNVPKAVEYLRRAGQQAFQRSANAEAIRQLGMALELLGRLPDTPERSDQELALQLAIGPALMAAKGWAAPEVEATYTRAVALCRQVGKTPYLFTAQLGLRMFYQLRAEYKAAKELDERLLSFAENSHNPSLLIEARYLLGMTLFRQGELGPAHAQLGCLERSASLYDPDQLDGDTFVHGRDPRTVGGSSLGLILWYMGYPDQAVKQAEASLALARSIPNFVSLGQTLVFNAELHQLRHEVQLTKDCAAASMALSAEQGLPVILAWGSILHGWALAQEGNAEDGMARLRQGLADYEATGARLGRSYFLALLAQTYTSAGQCEAGQNALAEAIAVLQKTGERYYEAELNRLRGELLLLPTGGRTMSATDNEAAQTCFHEAIAVARRQGARSLELRAALSLARLWTGQGETRAARQLLAAVHGSFTEGFGTADLQQAKVLLDELARFDT